MTLWHTIGLIGNVMACYGRKSKFADVRVGIGIRVGGGNGCCRIGGIGLYQVV